MGPTDVELHPEAIEEARAARQWYAARNEDAAKAFSAELDRVIDQLARFPERWPEYLYETRHMILRGFPYVVVYRTSGDRIHVIAVAHAKRQPGYWKSRVIE